MGMQIYYCHVLLKRLRIVKILNDVRQNSNALTNFSILNEQWISPCITVRTFSVSMNIGEINHCNVSISQSNLQS